MLKEIDNDVRSRTRKAYDPVPALKALGHPLRYSMFELLAGGEKCVCKLVDAVDASQPLVSHHLAILKKAGLIRDRQDSTWVYYSVDAENWEAFRRSMANLHPADVPASPCPPEDVR